MESTLRARNVPAPPSGAQPLMAERNASFCASSFCCCTTNACCSDASRSPTLLKFCAAQQRAHAHAVSHHQRTAIRLMCIGRGAHAAVSRRSSNPSNTIVARTEGYTYNANVWAVCLVQGPFSVAPCLT